MPHSHTLSQNSGKEPLLSICGQYQERVWRGTPGTLSAARVRFVN
jgi:hypothetical protein